MQMHFLEMKKEIVITFHRLYTKSEFHNKSFDILDSSYLGKKKKKKGICLSKTLTHGNNSNCLIHFPVPYREYKCLMYI